MSIFSSNQEFLEINFHNIHCENAMSLTDIRKLNTINFCDHHFVKNKLKENDGFVSFVVHPNNKYIITIPKKRWDEEEKEVFIKVFSVEHILTDEINIEPLAIFPNKTSLTCFRNSIKFNPSGGQMIVSYGTNIVRVYDISGLPSTWTCIHEIDTSLHMIEGFDLTVDVEYLKFTPCGNYILLIGSIGILRYDTNFNYLNTIESDFNAQNDNCFCFTPDMNHLFTGTNDGYIINFNTHSGNPIQRIGFYALKKLQNITCLRLSPDGKYLGVLTKKYNNISIFNIEEDKLIQELSIDYVTNFKFSVCGNYIISTCYIVETYLNTRIEPSKSFKTWEISSGNLICSYDFDCATELLLYDKNIEILK